MEWALIQPWRSIQEVLLNTGMNSTQAQLQWAGYPVISGAELCKRHLLETGPCLCSHLGSCYQHLRQQIWGRADIKGETGIRNWGWLSRERATILTWLEPVRHYVTAAPVVWEVVRHCSDLWVSRDVHELNTGMWHTKLQFLALCLSKLGILVVGVWVPPGPYAPFCLQKVDAWSIGKAQLGFPQ